MAAIEPLYAPDTTLREAQAAGWARVGETDNGETIWEADFEEKVGEEVIVINGKEQWVMAGSEPVKPKTRALMQTFRRRFVEVKQPNGGKFLNFAFEPDPAEKERLARRAAVAETQRTLAEKLVERGISVDALLDALGGDAGEKGRRKKSDA